ncbi:MAG TPA: single-stranded DNA-binding protein [Bacteroidia bacterium]|jgi:single-strand DNA-binding protein|nr:single-stranded DNA-binding protein [Bacteroidia bacterium]
MNTIKNNVQLIGNLARNPEVKEFEKGKKVANFVLGCSESYNDKEGRRVDNTNWFNAVAWNGLATIAEKYMTKGDRVAINGKLVNENWTDKDGKKHYITKVVVSDILLLTPKKA